MLRSAAVLLLLLYAALPGLAATFTVTDPGPTGPGTLRQAILDANANEGRDEIVFAVSNVTTESSLPAITDTVDINGFRSGARTIVGPDAAVDGLAYFRFSAGSAGSTIRGLRIRFTVPAVLIDDDVTNVLVSQNEITGIVHVFGDDNTVERNIGSFSIRVSGNRNQILGNLTSTGQVNIFGGSNHRVGSATAGNRLIHLLAVNAPGLIVEGNNFNGSINQYSILLSQNAGAGPLVQGNTISGLAGIGASGAIVRNNIIEGSNAGVVVFSPRTGVSITGNRIVTDRLPIDLGDDGPTPNDAAPDADTGANSLQNFPILTSATLTPTSLVVSGTLTSAPLTPYQIELFSNDAANPDARTFLGSITVTTDATGNATFTQTITSPLPVAGEVITSTATNRGLVAIPGSTPNSTSEVSAPVALALPGGLGFATATQSVDEAAGTVTINVTRTGGSEGTVTVDYATSNGTATSPADYTATSGTLTFGPGVTTQSIVVPLTNNALPEADETFTVTLSNPTGGATLVNETTTITITDTDAAADVAPIPTASTWGLIALALGLTLVALRR